MYKYIEIILNNPPFLFGGLIYYSYLCTTELVINPTGGGPSGGRVDSNLLYNYINPRLLRI
jgi:hypothetical protein